MSITITEPPEIEPVSLEEAKLFLRVDHDAEDELIEDLIRTAREIAETLAGRAFIMRRVIETRDNWAFDACGAMRLSLGPISTLHVVRVARSDGVMNTLDADDYALDAASHPPRISFPGGSPPSPATSIAGIEIEYSAGYGDEITDVPEGVRQAMRLIVAALYEDRSGQVAAPTAARALLAPFAELRL